MRNCWCRAMAEKSLLLLKVLLACGICLGTVVAGVKAVQWLMA